MIGRTHINERVADAVFVANLAANGQSLLEAGHGRVGMTHRILQGSNLLQAGASPAFVANLLFDGQRCLIIL